MNYNRKGNTTADELSAEGVVIREKYIWIALWGISNISTNILWQTDYITF